MSKILQRDFDNDCVKSKKAKQENIIPITLTVQEQKLEEIAELKSISTLSNKLYELFRPLNIAGIHNFHRGLGPEMLHTLKLGALKNVIATCASLVEIYIDIEKLVIQPVKLLYKHSLAILDKRLKNCPVSSAMQTFFPVRYTKMRKSMSSMIHSKANTKSFMPGNTKC
jgi:hypothetical protein